MNMFVSIERKSDVKKKIIIINKSPFLIIKSIRSLN